MSNKTTAFDEDPLQSVGYLLRDSSRMILTNLQRLLEPHDVTLGQYFVLRELWQNEGITQRELSDRIAIQEPSTVAAIDAMEKRDLVVRVRSKADRRKIHLHLTAYGRSLRGQLLAAAASVINDATANFEGDEVDQLRTLLQKMKANLDGR